jgi:hypothetical protein
MAHKVETTSSGNGFVNDIHVPAYRKQKANDRSLIDAGVYNPIDYFDAGKIQKRAFRGSHR